MAAMLAALAALAAVPAGCTHASTGPGPLTADWRLVALPPAAAGRLILGDVLACGGRWYALGGVRTTGGVGATPGVGPTPGAGAPTGSAGAPTGSAGAPTGSAGAPTGSAGAPTGSAGAPTGNAGATPASVGATAGGTRPGAWTSTDGRSWTPVPLRATTPYGPQQVFSSAACSQDRVAALGDTSGGVHGNPRYNTWWGDTGGLTDVLSGLDLFGGDDAISVGRIAGGSGPSRYLVAGSWDDAAKRPHATVWTSADGTRFDRRDSDPALASTDALVTEAASATYAGDEWLLAGDATRAGNAIAREPVAWSSTDAIGWHREDVDHQAGRDEALQRITGWNGTALAIGVRGTGFGAWRRDPASHAWRVAGGFGRFTGDTLPGVTGVAVVTGRARPIVYVAGTDGAALRLWASTDAATWRPVRLPASFPAGGGRTLVVAAQAGKLLVAASGDTGARLWLADPPPDPDPSPIKEK